MIERRRQRPDGKYAPLRAYLADVVGPKVTLTFAEVEVILEDALPSSAWRSRGWWVSGFNTAPSPGWQGAGWRVECTDLREQTVTFVRQSNELSPSASESATS